MSETTKARHKQIAGRKPMLLLDSRAIAARHCAIRGGGCQRERLPSLEHQFQISGSLRSDSDLLRQGTEFLVPRLQRIRARRQVLDVKTSVLAADGEVGMLE